MDHPLKTGPIVVVEDEERVLAFIVRLQTDYGYRYVREAGSIEEAAQLRDLLPEMPALVIVDHILGKDDHGNPTRTHPEVLALWPGIPAIVISGYPPADPAYVQVTDDVYHAPDAPNRPRCWLMKPILRDRLALAVKSVVGLEPA